MPDLILDDQHRYYLDGVCVPGVSEIVERFGFSSIDRAPQSRLEVKAEYGKRVHKACELFDLGAQKEFPADITPNVQAWFKFRFECAEQLSEGALIDIKTGPSYPSHDLQLAAYQILAEENYEGVDWIEMPLYSQHGFAGTPDRIFYNEQGRIKHLWCVHLSGDNFSVNPMIDNKSAKNTFIGLVHAYHWGKRKGLIK